MLLLLLLLLDVFERAKRDISVDEDEDKGRLGVNGAGRASFDAGVLETDMVVAGCVSQKSTVGTKTRRVSSRGRIRLGQGLLDAASSFFKFPAG